MATDTSTTTISSVGFLNLFGIFVSIVLCVMFIILGGHALKYIKAFAVKIKIIVNRAEDKNVQLKDFNYEAQGKKHTPAYDKMEQVFKNEIKKSRSLQFCNIFKSLIAKYDHIIYYPFRDRISEQYDLLKPKTSFYTLLVICTACVAWMTTIFLTAILQSSYSNVTLIPMSTFIGLTIAIAIISSILNLIATNRLFRIYLLNIKSAFKVDYGHKYLMAAQGMKDYEPENSQEEEELFKHQGTVVGGKVKLGQDHIRNKSLQQDGPANIGDQMTQRTMREETQLNSTRKLLGEDFEKSDKIKMFNNKHEQTVIEEHKDEDLEDPKDELIKKTKGKKGKAIKDIFDLQVAIEGADDADEDKKYIFIEDQEAIGDEELLNNEASKGENGSNVTTFIVLFVVIAVAAAVCCYLNYTFADILAQYVFYMFVGSFFGDILVSRPIILLLMSLFKFCSAKKKGYSKIDYKSPQEIKDLMGKAIKDMFEQRRKLREQYKQEGSGDHRHLAVPKTEKTQNHSGYDNASQEDMIDKDYITQNGFDRNDTKMPHNKTQDDHKEDEFAHVINEHGDEDPDQQKNPILGLQKAFHPTDFARPKIEMDQKNFEKTQTTTQAFNAHVPLISNLQKALRDKEDQKYGDIMEKKQLVNELADYNLLLLRKIYDAYEERGEKVLKNFRSDKNGVLRKRFMVPILNPNYDYEKLLKEMQNAGKGALKDEVEEDSVHLDGVTVCEDFEKDLMDAIVQEASENLDENKVERQRIDKYGRPIDENKNKEGVQKATPLPFYGEIEQQCEENIEEDDEEARRRQLLEDLRRRLANGEELTAEELALLEQLENQRLAELDRLIKELLSKGFDNLTDHEKLTLFGYQKERLNILLDQLLRKKNLTEEDHKRIKEIKRELKWLEYQELLLKKKMGLLTEEELRRLEELEREFELEELEALRRKILDGSITEEELARLRMLESKYGLEHMVNPFEKKQEEEENVEDQNLLQEEEEELSENNRSRLTDKDNFAELAPVHVMNNHSRAQSPDKDKRLTEEELEQQRLLEEQKRIEEEQKRLEEEQRLLKEQQELNSQENTNVFDQNLLMTQEEKDRKAREEEEELLKKQKLEQEQLEEELRLKQEQQRLAEEERLKLLQEEEEKRRIEREEEEERIRQEHENEQQRLQELHDQERLKEEQLQKEEEERLLKQQQLDEEEERLRDEELRKQQEIEELERRRESGTLTPEEEEELLRKQQEQEILRQQQEELQRQQDEADRLREQQELEKERLREEQQRLEEEILQKQRQQELLQQQREQEERERLQALEEAEKERQRQIQEEQEREMDRLRQLQEDQENERMRIEAMNAASPADQSISSIIHSRRSGSSDEAGMSRIGSRQQDRINQELKLQQNLEDQDLMMRKTNEKFMDPDYAFGHDDLEFGQINAPGGANGEEESIYSHKTTTILDEEKVSFMHIDQLPNADNASEDSFDEQDMVYYNKDDLTNYSKGLGLNKVKARQPQANYYSENDLHQVNENDLSGDDSERNRTGRSGRSYDPANASRAGYGRGKLKHRQLEGEEFDMDIEGRVKVDAWNLNYKRKKKKLKKKKLTDAQKRKMDDLQNIYGVDAKTLAGLSNGRLPRQLLASGKLKDDGFGGNDSRLGGPSDMSFRSTKNTFMVKDSTAAKSRMRDSVNDAQSNLFSMNGFGTSKRWNDIESGLRGNALRGYNASQLDQQSNNTRMPFTGRKQMTATQENFKRKINRGSNGGNDFLEEESKDYNSGSRNSSMQRNFNSKNKLNNSKLNKGKKGNKNNGANKRDSSLKKQNQRRQSDDIDYHSESDEAVDDNGAMFQKRNGPWNNQFNKGGMNDFSDNHSESEEGNNQDNPDFSGNQFVLKKRAPQTDQAAHSQAKKGFGNYQLNKQPFIGNSGNKRRGGRGSNDDLSIEDLEAQQIGGVGARGKKTHGKGKNFNQGSSNKKGGFGKKNNQFATDGFMRDGSVDRDDSDDENPGGEVMFQKQNLRSDFMDQNDNGLMNRSGELGFGGHIRNNSNNKLNLSNSKPPLSGSKRQGSRRGRQGDGIDRRDFTNIYGDPYNIGGIVHPGVSEDVRQANGNYGPFNLSDSEHRIKRNLGDSDNEAYSSQSKRRKGLDQQRNHNLRSTSNPNLLDPSLIDNRNNQTSRRNHNRSVSGNRKGQNDENENDYIVGPESTHSQLKKRPLNGSQRSRRSQDEDRYMLLQRERQIIEDIESDRQTDMNTSKLAKKRKIKRAAAQSQNTRDQQARRYQEMQNERLRRKQREAESALFAKDDDLEKGQVKSKKNKAKKEWVRKEVNYWLDYDSPYAEYLVARFREWSPQTQVGRVSHLFFNHKFQGGPAPNKQASNKYKEVQNVYSKGPEIPGRQGSQNSRSRERHFANEGSNMMNISQQKKSKIQGKNGGGASSHVSANHLNVVPQQNVNTLFVDDYEEP